MVTNPEKQPSMVQNTPEKQPSGDILYLHRQLEKINERFNKMAAAFHQISQKQAPYERIYYMHPERSEKTDKLDAAHSESLGELKNVEREARGNRGRYAKIEHIMKHVNPIIKKYGLSFQQDIISNEYGDDVLKTIFKHSSGQWREARKLLRKIPRELKTYDQEIGASITYQRRYAVLSMLGIGATDDPSDTLE